MDNILKIFFVSVITTLIILFLLYNFIPLDLLEVMKTKQSKFGSTITTIAGTDTLSSSRTVINTNFSNLNTDKFELSDWYATTSKNNLAGIGTITSGIWNGTVIRPQYGGTGWDNLVGNTILLGNGTGNIATTTQGTEGQILALLSSVPTWSGSILVGSGTSTVNATLKVVDTFSASSTLLVTGNTNLFASTTINSTTTPTQELSIRGDIYLESSNSTTTIILGNSGSNGIGGCIQLRGTNGNWFHIYATSSASYVFFQSGTCLGK